MADRPVPAPATSGGEYTLGRLLGQGKYGKVFLATRTEVDAEGKTTQMLVAYKIISTADRDERTAVRQEINILLAVRGCPHTLRIIDASPLDSIGSPQSGDMFIITEYYNGGTLKGIMKALCDTPKCAKRVTLLVLVQIAKALACMHRAGYVHTDLKPDNILLSVPEGTTAITSSNVKDLRFILADYGLAQRTGATGVVSGTPLFMPPEVFSEATPADPSRDIWALGVTIYLLMYGEYPFKAGTLPTLMYALRNTDPEFKPMGIPGQVELVKKMLSKDPSERPTAQDVIASIRQIVASSPKDPA